MSKYLIISVFLAASSVLFAQNQQIVYANARQIEDFFNTKTMVVMDANTISAYNIAIVDAMEKYWTITPFEIITSEQFDNMRNNPELSFIWQPTVRLERDRQRVYYLYMSIVMGGNARNLESMPTLLNVPLAYTGVDEEDYIEKLPLMIRFAQIHINNLRGERNPRNMHNLSSYNRTNSGLLRNMILLVQESDLSEEVNTLEKISAVYPGVVKIVDLDELNEAIESHAPNTAVLHQVGPAENENSGRSYRQIYGTEDGKLYYYNHQRIGERLPQGMLLRDFRLIR